jgi:ribosome-binding protein aMBF1 (putative translation factor)
MGSGMLGVMYTIKKDASGVILVCLDCPHTERVNKFDGNFGKSRTQAARAMLKHVRNEHSKEPTGKPLPQVMERWH